MKKSAVCSRRVAGLALAMTVSQGCAQGEPDSSGMSGDDAQSGIDAQDEIATDAGHPPASDGSSDDAGDDAGGDSGDDTSAQDAATPGDDSAAAPDTSTTGDASAGDDGQSDATAPAEASAEAGADAGADAGVDASSDAAAEATPSGCPCAPQFSCVAGSCSPARRVFVSSAVYDGNLGGHAGADAKCQSLANAAHLGGTWMAWVSDASSSPAQRFAKASVGYRLLDGTLIAASWTALTGGASLMAPIDITDTGASLATADKVTSRIWTATSPHGSLDVVSCASFASNATTQTGEVGHCTFTGTAPTPDGGQPTNWTASYAAEPCNVTHHIYCFEQ
jgi:hypothetical protein